MRLSEVYAKSYTSLSSVINIFPDFVNAPLKLFNLVDNLSHAESAENTELPVLESLVHAGAGFHRLGTRFTVPAWRGSNA